MPLHLCSPVLNLLGEFQVDVFRTLRTLVQIPVESSLLDHLGVERISSNPLILVLGIGVDEIREAFERSIFVGPGDGVDSN